MSYCGSAEAIFRARKRELLRIPGVGEKLAARIGDKAILASAEAELRYLERSGITCIFYLDDAYPARLKAYTHSPILLFSKGRMELNPGHAIAVVGTRSPTQYGKSRCEQIVADLVPYHPTIVSGLAYGIDVTAHRAAVRHGLPTIGVLGSGFGSVYPRAHEALARHMMSNGGLLTEFWHQTGPDRENFPARNRIVAGLVDAVVVVESGKSGGSMITVEFADAFHRDIFALPGRVGDTASEGCNHLIKTHRAHLIESGKDIAELLRWADPKSQASGQKRLFEDLTEVEQILTALITEHSDAHVDKLAAGSGLPMGELASVLLSLEFKGVVKALPGKRYTII